MAVLTVGSLDLSLLDDAAVISSCIGRSVCVIIFLYSRIRVFCLLSSGGAIWLSGGNQKEGVVFIQPVTRRMVEFSCTSSLWVWWLFSQTGAHYSAVLNRRPSAAHRRVEAVDPHVDPHNFCMILFLDLTFVDVFSRCGRYVRVLSSVTPGYFGLIGVIWIVLNRVSIEVYARSAGSLLVV